MSGILSSSGFRRGGIGLGVSQCRTGNGTGLEQVLLLASHELKLEVPLKIFGLKVSGADPAIYVGDETVLSQAVFLPDEPQLFFFWEDVKTLDIVGGSTRGHGAASGLRN